ncbi:MAG: histidine phosphatase family protein [Oscillospiraceae bacterium]|nr:histidine phosphatase family protein [Oscillospiraceae bacterium]
MEIFFLRHFESEKNIKNSMSNSDTEKLTLNGRTKCLEFARSFKEFCKNKNINISEIIAVESCRAKESAEIIASEYGNLQVKTFTELKSTDAGNLAGKSLTDIQKKDPFFSKHYMLYRKGLMNSYFFDENWHDDKKELKKDFEKRVNNCFEKIVSNSESENLLIVGHRSSITAILISIARKMGLYPNDFYGSIDLSLGLISWVTLNSDNKTWCINFVNSKLEKLK